MKVVGLLWWNTGNCIFFTEFHIAKSLRMYIELCGRLQNAECEQRRLGEDGARAAVQRNSSTNTHITSRTTGVAKTHYGGLYSYHLRRVQTSLTGRPMAATTATRPVWHSVHWWVSVYLRLCCQHKGFAPSDTTKSIYEVAELNFQHRFSVNMRCGV